jgi:Lhr-like helicase/DNA-binding Lrp family transcriptional regulator
MTGINFVDDRSSLDEVMERMDPVVERWFRSRFDSLTAPQATAIPLIDERHSTLISSPTGSGKTITAFLSVINQLFRLNQLGELEDRIYCVYVSPLKALANDIHKNLELPLEEIQEMARKEGLTVPDIRVAVRSGDTSTAERQRMVKRPPHIFITTPESLSLVLSTRKFSEKFVGVEWVIIDEIHDLCSSKRGTLLSLALEHLQARVGEPLTRVGLSATQAPIEEIAGFLVGSEEDEVRDVNIVQVNPEKEVDLQVLIPVDDLEKATYKDAEAEMHKMLVGLVKEHQTTLIFTNTRAATETLVMKLKELGIQHVAAHHGSMSKEKRLDVERSLKRGQLQAIVSSTSLELGIDIGSIDLVVQIGSPKSISKLMQRIGRSGHSLYRVTKGRVVALDPMELEECTVLVHAALEGEVDLVRIPSKSLDVLSQFLVGLAIVEPWSIDGAFELVRSSYPYRDLERDDYDRVLESLGEVARLKHRSVYAKLWIDWENGRFGSKQGARLIYFTNVGTIPEESTWRVFSEKGVPLGNLSERFIERVRPKEVFVLGGKTYEFIQTKGTKVFVRDAHGRKPTIPSWAGEAMSRSRELAMAVTRLRDQMATRMEDDTQSEVVEWLGDEYNLGRELALNLIRQYRSQITVSGHVPSANRLLVEGYTDVRGDPNIIVHTSLGRSVNEVLARICAIRVARKHDGLRVRTVLDDDSFALLLDEEVDPEEVADALRKVPLEKDLREVLPGSELFHQRFRHCSTRAFLVLRNYRGREVPIARQHQQAARLYDDLVEDVEFPVTKEAYEESLHQAMDLETAEAVTKEVASGDRSIKVRPYSDRPSPFAFKLLLMGMSDLLLIEDRSVLLRELHADVLAKVMPEVDISKPRYEREEVEDFFAGKRGMLEYNSKEGLLELLERIGPLPLTTNGTGSLMGFTQVAPVTVECWLRELVKEEKVVSFWCHKLVWAHADHDGMLSVLYPPPTEGDLSPTDGKLLSIVQDSVTTAEVTTAADKAFKRRGSPMGPQIRDALLDLQVRNALRLATVPTLEEMEVAGEHDEMALDDLAEAQPPSESEEEEMAEEVTTVEPAILAEDASCEYGASPETEAWEVRKVSDVPVEDAAKWYVRTYLEHNPPGPLSRVAYDLDLDPELVRGTLRTMEDEGEVAAGAFVGGETPQYMLWVDKNTFEGLAKGRRVVRENVARQFALDKFFMGFDKIEDFFDTFLAAGLPFDIFNRLTDFQLDDWWDLQDSGEVLHGRFVRGHVFFTTAKLAQLLASAYRTENLDKMDLEVFDTISANQGISAAGAAKALGLKREEVQPSIDKLDRNVYIIRKFIEKKAWSSRNLYLPFELTDPVKDSKKLIIESYIKGTGPLTFTAVRSFTDFPFNEVLTIVNELQEEGVIERVLVVGDTSVDMYVHKDDAEKLARMEAKVRLEDPLRVLSLYDPYIQHMWAELTTRYGEGWIFPVVRNGKLCGMVEKWRMSGVVDIREIKLDDLALLEELLDELDRQMAFYRQFGLEVIRIRGAFGRKVPDLPVKLRNRFIKKGYHLVQDFLAKGDMVPRSFPRENVYAYLFHKQHIAPSLKFNDVMDAAKAMGGMRSDFEASLRVRKMRKLKRYVKSGDLVAGLMIPAHLMYSTRRDMLIYKVAKSRPMTDDMSHLVKMMDAHEGVTRRELMESAEMGRDRFEPAFNALYEGLYIIRDPSNLYVLTPEPRLDQPTARRVVLERMIANVGLVSAEGLAMMSKHEFKIDEIKATLGRLEQAGKLAKGFFVEEDESLYWIIKKDIEVIPKMSFKYSFVLSPFDQLAQLLSQEIRRKFRIGSCFVIFVGSEMAGAFKGTKKGNTLTLTEFIGGDRERKVLRLFEREWGLSVRKPTKTQEIDDWELMRYWEEHAY